MDHKGVHVLIPRNCICSLTWQREIKFANQLTLEWRGYPGLSGWVQCNHRYLYKWRIRERDVITEAETTVIQKSKNANIL